MLHQWFRQGTFFATPLFARILDEAYFVQDPLDGPVRRCQDVAMPLGSQDISFKLKAARPRAKSLLAPHIRRTHSETLIEGFACGLPLRFRKHVSTTWAKTKQTIEPPGSGGGKSTGGRSGWSQGAPDQGLSSQARSGMGLGGHDRAIEGRAFVSGWRDMLFALLWLQRFIAATAPRPCVRPIR